MPTVSPFFISKETSWSAQNSRKYCVEFCLLIFEGVDRQSAWAGLAAGCRFGRLAKVAYADGDVGHVLGSGSRLVASFVGWWYTSLCYFTNNCPQANLLRICIWGCFAKIPSSNQSGKYYSFARLCLMDRVQYLLALSSNNAILPTFRLFQLLVACVRDWLVFPQFRLAIGFYATRIVKTLAIDQSNKSFRLNCP